jgi:hypothetical protein
MPRLAFAQSFWDGYDTLEKPVRAGVPAQEYRHVVLGQDLREPHCRVTPS